MPQKIFFSEKKNPKKKFAKKIFFSEKKNRKKKIGKKNNFFFRILNSGTVPIKITPITPKKNFDQILGRPFLKRGVRGHRSPRGLKRGVRGLRSQGVILKGGSGSQVPGAILKGGSGVSGTRVI